MQLSLNNIKKQFSVLNVVYISVFLQILGIYFNAKTCSILVVCLLSIQYGGTLVMVILAPQIRAQMNGRTVIVNRNIQWVFQWFMAFAQVCLMWFIPGPHYMQILLTVMTLCVLFINNYIGSWIKADANIQYKTKFWSWQ